MGNEFYVQRGDKSFGPYSHSQLKGLAQQGQLRRDDVVRDTTSGMSAKAADTAGLFQIGEGEVSPSVVDATVVEDGPTEPRKRLHCRTCGKEVNEKAVRCLNCGMTPRGGSQFCPSCGGQTLPAAIICVKCGVSLGKAGGNTQSPKPWYSWPVVATSLLFCFPLGFALVWSHPRWSRPTKAIWSGAWVFWSGAWMLLLVLGMVGWHHEVTEVRQIIVEAHQAWADGDRSKAVSRYRTAINRGVEFIDRKDRTVVLSRVLDYAAENGSMDEVKRLLERYSNEAIVPESAAGRQIVAQIREEQRRETERKEKEAEAAAQKLSQERGFNSLLGMIDELTLGKELTFGPCQIYYKSPVTEAEATRLGKFFVELGFFDDTEKTVQVAKSGNTYELRMPIKKGIEHDQEVVESLGWIGACAAESVFNGAHLDIHLCDDSLETIRVVPCN